MMIEELLTRYETSHFEKFVEPQDIASPADQARALKEYEHNPVAALIENVDRAKLDIRCTKDRLKEAELDGLFDRDAFRAADKQQKRRWTAAIDILRGDVQRALSELKHWREYVSWAIDEQTAKVAKLEAALPDKRLPPEHDEAVK